MSEYTAEDFAQSNLATRGEYMVARRCGGNLAPWAVFLHNRPALYVSDASMARYGWTPVMEVEDWKRRIDYLTATHDDMKNLLKDTADDLRRDLALAREELVDLRRENRRLDAEADGAISLDGLKAAWETAEVPTGDAPIREGDVVIVRHGGGGFTVELADRILSGQTHGRERILSRAPREPWAELEDVLRNEIDLESDPGGIAHALHLKGWRKTGGDES